ncbi:hypothetical protein [Enterococcus sp. AZ072]|uniref:hypothetical protein n=1 Tax=unclassified Enterococcus TaxID=2608891 RepID=UPI003D2976CA
MKKRDSSMIDSAIFFNHRSVWTEKDDAELMQLSESYPDREIAVLIGRTIPSIWNRRNYLINATAVGKEVKG